MRCGFTEFDITPPPGTHKGGWMEHLHAEVVLDPLYGRVGVFDDGAERIALIQLDLLSLRWTHVHDIRQRIESAHGFPGDHIMVACTHNHAGPATAGLAPVVREETYNERLTQQCVQAFTEALAGLTPAEIGLASVSERTVAHNRRTFFADGTVQTQRALTTQGAVAPEGPIDPELAVLAARDLQGRPLGCLVNFACHPVHHGGTNEITAGFPGVVTAGLKAAGWPCALYLNGPYGNLITALSMQDAGARLLQDAQAALEQIAYAPDVTVGCAHSTLDLRYREITDDEYHGRVVGAQRFRSDELYEGAIDRLVAGIQAGKQPRAEVQVLRIGNCCLAGIPAEYFVEHGLRIKAQSRPRKTLVIGGANGMLGYVPTRQAFSHGGYETTLGPPSRMAPETGDLLADEAIRLIRTCG